MNQIDLLNKLVELNSKLALSNIISSADLNGNIITDHRGTLTTYGFDADVELTLTFRMKKKAFIEINELLSEVVKS